VDICRWLPIPLACSYALGIDNMRLISRLLRRSGTATVSWIEPEELSNRVATGRVPLVIDVRGPDEFTGPLGHIAGALNVPLPELAVRLPELSMQDRPLVLVCKTDRRSSAAAQQLRAAGSRDVTVLRGGMERWRALGLP
jgi:rhodanese-related sulfurtransferase